MIKQTTPEDVMEMHSSVRDEDEREVRSLTGLSILEALTIGLVHSEDCITGFSPEGDRVLIAGVVRGDPASVWMLSTPAISSCKREIVTEGRAWVEEMTAKYGEIANVVSADNSVHIGLLRFMGFEFGDPIDNYGTDMIRVLPFKRNDNV
jgi:hypothetical protein